jgi:hypothetical protein
MSHGASGTVTQRGRGPRPGAQNPALLPRGMILHCISRPRFESPSHTILRVKLRLTESSSSSRISSSIRVHSGRFRRLHCRFGKFHGSKAARSKTIAAFEQVYFAHDVSHQFIILVNRFTSHFLAVYAKIAELQIFFNPLHCFCQQGIFLEFE